MQQSLFGSVVLSGEDEAAPKLSPLASAIEDAVFTVIDLETTGLNARKNAITEIVAIQYKNGEEMGKYATLVKPTEPIPPEVEAITGISNDMVAQAPALVMALSELCGFVGTSPLIVGHNVAFDLNFLREKLDTSGLSPFITRFDPATAFCTKILAQKVLPGLPSYEGIVVANQCGVINDNPHRAEYDVRMSAGILFSLIRRLRERQHPIQSVEDLLCYQGAILL